MEEQQQLAHKGYIFSWHTSSIYYWIHLQCITLYGTFNNTKVSTGFLKSPISTESFTSNSTGLCDAISSGVCERYHNSENCLWSFFMEEIIFLRSEIN